MPVEAETSHGLRGRTGANAVAAAIQAGVGGLAVFVTYKFLVQNLGAAGVGTWSLVMTLSSLSTLPAVGLQGSIQHFVAARAAVGDLRGSADVVLTSLLVAATLVGVGVGAVLLLMPYLIKLVLGSGDASEALALMPWGLSCGWLLAMCASLQVCLDGLQKATTRAWMFLGATVFYMFVAVVLTKYYGLQGLAWANFAEYLLLFGCLIVGTARYFAKHRVQRATFRLGTLRSMMSYSSASQVTGIASVFFDPLAKSLLGRFSGLAEIGLFEMASRMVFQFRAVIVGACGILVPVFSGPQTAETGIAARRRYLEVLGLVTSAGLVVMLGLEGTSLGVAVIWVGWPSTFFAEAVTLLSLGWGLNTVTTPAFMVHMGQARLRWNVVGQCLTLVLLGLLGVAMAPSMGGAGLLWAYALALALGSLPPLLGLHRSMEVTTRQWLRVVDWRLVLYACAACAVGWVMYGLLSSVQSSVAASAMLAACTLVIVIGLVRSRTRRAMMSALVLRRKGE